MSEAPVRFWIPAPLPREVAEAIERLRRAPDVRHVAVMPDVHLASDVCIGVAMATSRLLYPQAVGGDIGCGILAVATDLDAAALRDGRMAGRILSALGSAVPSRRRNRRSVISQPAEVAGAELGCPALEAIRRSEGALEFATLGSGNHFLEMQADGDGRVWLMVHSGSRAMGPAIRDHYLARAGISAGKLKAIEAESADGRAYFADAAWARRYAHASRHAIAEQAGEVIARHPGGRLCWETAITTDHNHVCRESAGGEMLLIHRKGAMSARAGQAGVLPGSMGTLSFHIEGRGCAEALHSSAHGAGRAASRTEARAQVSENALKRQMEGVWFDVRIAGRLRDEAPSAYKDIRTVLRAQRELVKVTRVLRPLLSYKGT